MDISEYKASLKKDIAASSEAAQFSNPMSGGSVPSADGLSSYTKDILRPKHDSDMQEILEAVRVLNNLAPIKMPEYSFNVNEINGESYYKPDGTLLLIREYDSDVIRDYYVSNDDKEQIAYIKEHDKNTGRLRVKVDPVIRDGDRKRTNITVFDEKINHKYTIFQLSDGGIVNNITEFSGIGKSFRTLFRNITNYNPVRYLEGKDSKDSDFEMVDCLFDAEGHLARIRRYNNKKEVNINYTDNKKTVSVKNKQ